MLWYVTVKYIPKWCLDMEKFNPNLERIFHNFNPHISLRKQQGNTSSIYSRYSEASASECLKDIEEIFPY